MVRSAPFAEAIRALRPRVERARRAHTDAWRLQGIAPETATGAPGLVGELVSEIANTWPEFGLTAGDLRAALLEAAAGMAKMEAELSRLRHEQHDALHDEAWADVVASVRELALARDGLVADLSRARTQHTSATSLRDAIDGTLAEAEALGEPAAGALYEAARESFEGLLLSLGLQLPSNATKGREWLESTRAALHTMSALLAPEVEAQEQRVATLDAVLEDLLG